ncbi:acyltransferase [Paenarthrobacter sp. NPDC089316]|uniref:acyltransferase family protein n=1 Tax=unclassified Paenarthrobacter TaxID=2634190 RepID=UPI00344066D4
MNSEETTTAIRRAELTAGGTPVVAAQRPFDVPKSAPRDLSIDVVRSLCLIVVVLLHALMVGVSIGPEGPVLENALDGQEWFVPVTWFAQIMPLFFIAGGFSSISQWRSLSARGVSAADYVRSRLLRLLVPAAVMVGAVGAGLLVLTLAGLPSDIVSTAGYRISQPLWFLAVYIGCSALVPLMARAHQKARIRTMLGLFLCLLAVDALRIMTDQTAVGYANLAFVWLFIQQLGFWLADGFLERTTPAVRGWIAGLTLGLLMVSVAAGWYSADMYVNLNPPTGALALLAVIQLMIFSLCQPAIRAWAENPAVMQLTHSVGTRAMTIYLWHMPVLVAVAGMLLILPLHLPVPGSAEWWFTRSYWLAACLCALVPTVHVLGIFERAGSDPRDRPSSSSRVVFSTLLGVVGVIVLLVEGITPITAGVSVLLFSCALTGHTNLPRLRPVR